MKQVSMGTRALTVAIIGYLWYQVLDIGNRCDRALQSAEDWKSIAERFEKSSNSFEDTASRCIATLKEEK